MSIHLIRSVDILKKKILSLGTAVEENVFTAVRSVETLDEKLAETVIAGDALVDEAEIDVEEDALRILALYQPVAADLRFIVAVLKLNSDLERIGDLAVNIARRTRRIVSQPPVENRNFDFHEMFEYSRKMLSDSLDSLIHLDASLAHGVCASDAKLDAMNNDIQIRIKKLFAASSHSIDTLVDYLAIARCLERIGDHATNIAEDVIYLVQGGIVRHNVRERDRTRT